VEKVTAADVLRVANKYVHKEELKVLVVGNISEYQKQLAALGPVTPIDITIPTSETSGEAPKPAGSNAEGMAAAAKLLQSLGGVAKLSAVKTLHQSFVMAQQGEEMKVDQSIVYPDKQAQKMSMPQGEMLQVVTSAIAFMVMGSQVRDLPPDMHSAELTALKRDFINVLQHANDAKYSFTAGPREKLGDVEATVVDVNADGAQTRWWIDANGTLLQERFTEARQTIMTIKYSDWKSFDGLMYPTKYEMLNGDEAGGNLTMSAMEVNAAVDPKLFEKPQQ
jgi:outer membrane lipoprotein-sorting protein